MEDRCSCHGKKWREHRAFKQQGSGFTYGAFSPVKSIKIELLEATDTFRNYTGYTSAKAAIDSFAAKIGGMSTYYNQNGYDYVRGGKEMIFATAKNAKVSSGVYNISIYNTGYDNLVLYGAYVGEPIKDAVWKIKQSGYVYTGLLNGNTYAFRSTDRHKAVFLKESGGKVKSWEYDIVSSQIQIGELNQGFRQGSGVSRLASMLGI